METEQKKTEYQSVLADLETKREELDRAIAVIKREIGLPVTASPSGHSSHSKHEPLALTPTSFFGMTVGDAAMKYLELAKEPKPTPEIARVLQQHGIKTLAKDFTVSVFSALERKVDAGEVVHPKRGLWGLAQWYPGLRTAKKENGGKKEGVAKMVEAQQEPEANQPAQAPIEANRRAFGIADNSGAITIGALEDFVRQKPRRMKEITAQFGVAAATVKKLLEPASKVYVAGIGWFKVRE